ncbi:GAF domain-containing SpoIIE family protein phosphatase [Nocardioides sp.]|uniref:PP2C family protein-serine/threonine phosphatase n=1 Tax=Nocardioides sp. TaxID=35761 RepID=UPI002C50FE5F|nr:GAF domain-containing SpoIIE family protein phosphatase [Nocardioides sp.]HXH79313.1 GAF domain-containing SpoIIE family protein phosphatase [Nocardioides sp.]
MPTHDRRQTDRPAGASTPPAGVERRRQRAVDSLGLSAPLRQLRDARFERITRVASKVLDTAWASITVLDGDQAWFPSAHGFDIPLMARDETFCSRTTAYGRVTVVPDATLDPDFASLPLVVGEGIRFYAGVPLVDPTGNIVGVFCVYDHEPRTLPGEDLQTLEDLAAWAQQELIGSGEMLRAGRVQAAMLPAAPIRTDGWHVDGICMPALAVGGDTFDYALTDAIVHIGLGDVMGKGTGAALVGAGVRAAVRSLHLDVVQGADLGAMTHRLSQVLQGDLDRAESFVTLFQCAIDTRSGAVRYVDAGAGLCVVVRVDGSVERMASEDRPIGILPEDTWTQHRTTLEPGERMLMFSDGLLDLLEDQVEWWHEVGRLVADHADPPGLLTAIRMLTVDQLGLDDVTAVAVYRASEEGE